MIVPTITQTNILTKLLTKIMLTRNANARSTNVNARSTNVNARSTVEERRFQRRVPCTDVMRASAPVVALLSSNPSLSTPLKN
jgi:hypothetical protein